MFQLQPLAIVVCPTLIAKRSRLKGTALAGLLEQFPGASGGAPNSRPPHGSLQAGRPRGGRGVCGPGAGGRGGAGRGSCCTCALTDRKQERKHPGFYSKALSGVTYAAFSCLALGSCPVLSAALTSCPSLAHRVVQPPVRVPVHATLLPWSTAGP